VPKFVVCDNLKAAVTNPDRYEPGLNRSYLELADHYGMAILPARPCKPRDKAKVEQSVLIAERWILARLRNRCFFSIADLNVAIAELVRDINARLMKGFNASRAELFATIDTPALKNLPDELYAFAVWKRCRVAPDYHVEVDGHWYSAPFRLIKELVDARVADKTVEIFHKGLTQACIILSPVRDPMTLAGNVASASRIKLTWGFLNQGVKISSASVKLQWLFRYPRSEPFYVTWSLPHQIKLTFGRRSRRLRQDPACGGWGSGERDHS
jgi:hypothetical protein